MVEISGFRVQGLGIRVYHCDVAKGFEVRVNDRDGCACFGCRIESVGFGGARIVPEPLTDCYVSRGGCVGLREGDRRLCESPRHILRPGFRV